MFCGAALAWSAVLTLHETATRRMAVWIARMRSNPIAPFLFLELLLIVLPLFFAWMTASIIATDLKHVSVSAVFRKGESTPVQGKLLFQLSRYVLILGDNNSVIAIPQTEVQMIQTQGKSQSRAGASPVSSHPSATATVSATSSKPK